MHPYALCYCWGGPIRPCSVPQAGSSSPLAVCRAAPPSGFCGLFLVGVFPVDRVCQHDVGVGSLGVGVFQFQGRAYMSM